MLAVRETQTITIKRRKGTMIAINPDAVIAYVDGTQVYAEPAEPCEKCGGFTLLSSTSVAFCCRSTMDSVLECLPRATIKPTFGSQSRSYVLPPASLRVYCQDES